MTRSTVHEPVWVDRIVADAVHVMLLQEHGGMSGTRDENALLSALNPPRAKCAYEPGTDIAPLAAPCAYGLAVPHPYVDGNKRTAFVVAAIFLELNGCDLDRSDDEVVDTMVAVVKRTIDEESLAGWIRVALVRKPLPPGTEVE